MRWPLFLALVACGPSSSPQTSTPPQGPATDVGDDDVDVDVDDGDDDDDNADDDDRPAEFATILGLDSTHIELVRSYEASVQKASTTRDPAPTCTAIGKAYEVADALLMPLLTQRDALFDDPKYDAFTKAVDRLRDTLFGVGFAVGAEAMYAWVDNDDFGFTGQASAMAALSVADNLVKPWPDWLRQVTDITGCVQLERAKRPLERLVNKAEWDAAPACLKAQLGPKVFASLTAMSESTCYCDDKSTVAARVAEIAAMMEKLTSLDGKALADQLRKSSSSSDARFECSPG